jgi:hypothetical protein
VRPGLAAFGRGEASETVGVAVLSPLQVVSSLDRMLTAVDEAEKRQITEEKARAKRLPPGMKRCARCHKIKPLDSFYRHHRSSDGRVGRCKLCFGGAMSGPKRVHLLSTTDSTRCGRNPGPVKTTINESKVTCMHCLGGRGAKKYGMTGKTVCGRCGRPIRDHGVNEYCI